MSIDVRKELLFEGKEFLDKAYSKLERALFSPEEVNEYMKNWTRERYFGDLNKRSGLVPNIPKPPPPPEKKNVTIRNARCLRAFAERFRK